MAFDVRRVVTGHDSEGAAVFVSDGAPPHTIDAANSFGVSDLWWLDAMPATVADGGESPDGPVVLEPPPGGMSIRVIRMPPPAPGTPDDDRWIRVPGDDPARPGMHTTDTLDFMTVLDGEITLGLDDGEHALAAGDVVIQRGTAHRWRVSGDGPCTYVVFMFRRDPSAPEPIAPMDVPAAGPGADAARSSAAVGPRRIVTGTDAAGRSFAVSDGPAPNPFQPAGPDSVALVELWQTGGPLLRNDQGGDPRGSWELEPRGGGIAFRYIEMPPGNDPGDAGWHTTATIDLDFMLAGRLQLALPGVEPVTLGPGDSVVQRGTHHQWKPVGDETVRYVAVMVAVADTEPAG
jgi:quercetin dioxygenase-like cupin family protein